VPQFNEMKIFLNIALFFYFLSTIGYLTYLVFQKEYLHKTGFCLLIAGFVFHLTAILFHFITSGYIPAYTLHETLSITGLAVAGVYLLFQIIYNLKILGVYAAPLVTLIMTVASFVPSEPSNTGQVYKSLWLALHIITVFTGYAAFAMAFGTGLLYLIQEHGIKSKRQGFFYKRLPSLELIDGSMYLTIITGFTLLTIGIITGSVYAKSVWNSFWRWDPKEVWTAVTWISYAIMLHQRKAYGWRGRKAAIMSIIGFAVLLFTFLGVNFLLQGHHGVFTQ
jgi:cytochrome c-type biogenesis protein CcsB